MLTASFAEVGDFVEQDEEIATIETDKVSFLSHHNLDAMPAVLTCSRSTLP
jgi:hypothetical protein